ncbi:MAG TPA: hypothetical protein VFS39_09490 [Nitrospira sp.]|nr:hypothetical protein [Nitrospira sp.]
MLAILLGSVLATAPAGAAEWSLVPSMAVQGVYNDNLLLTPLPHRETYGFWLSPGAEFGGTTERLEVSGRAAADFVSYYGGQDSSFTNIHLPVTARYKTEKDQFAFTGGFVRDNTLMGELLTTGVVLQFTQRNQWNVYPSWSRNVTEKLSVQSSVQFVDTTYENGVRLSLVDYQLLGGTGGVSYQVTERDLVQVVGSYAGFRTTNAPSPFRANFPGLNVVLNHAFTETVSGSVYGGPRFVTTTSAVGGGSVTTHDTVWLFGANVAKKFDNGSVQATVARDIVPSGFGLLIQTDRASVSGSYKISERLTASLDTAGFITSSPTKSAIGASFPETRFVNITPKIGWQFMEWWKVELSYTFRWRDVDTFSDPATSNGTVLMLTYYPPKLTVSQ